MHSISGVRHLRDLGRIVDHGRGGQWRRSNEEAVSPLRWLSRWFGGGEERPAALDDVVLLVETDDGPAVAEMWRGMLESAGIRAMVQGGDPMQIYGFARVPMRLFVRRRDVAKARQVLSLAPVADDST
jgi:hypothetical protein